MAVVPIRFLKQVCLIFTNKSIFHVPLNVNIFSNNIGYQYSIAQIHYSDCKKISVEWGMLTLRVEYLNGKAEKYYHIDTQEKKKIKALFKTAPTTSIPSSQNPKRTHLCPQCTNMLIENEYKCPTCSLVFKNPDRALRLSLLWPGGGYFYTRHPILGLVSVIFELLSIVVLFCSFMGIIDRALMLFGGTWFLTRFCVSYVSNYYVKEFIPEDNIVTPFTKSQISALIPGNSDIEIHKGTVEVIDNDNSDEQDYINP